MCTSMMGPSNVFSASRMATEVWVKADVEAEPGTDLAAGGFHVGQGLAAIDLRLALAEEIEVGAVQYVDGLRHVILPALFHFLAACSSAVLESIWTNQTVHVNWKLTAALSSDGLSVQSMRVMSAVLWEAP